MGKMRGCSTFAAIIFIFNYLVGCTNNSEIYNDIDEIKIGVTVYKEDDKFISTITNNILELAKKKEIEENVKITVDILDAKSNLANQCNQVDKFILNDYDVICVNIVDRTSAATIIDKAKNSNTPIIFFNREPVEEDMRRWNEVYYVGAEAEQSGELQGNLIIDKYYMDKDSVDKNGDGKIQYVMLEGEHGHQDTAIRTEYSIKTIVQSGIEVEKLADDTANWEFAQAKSKMTGWIKEFGSEIEVVFSNNDDMALGAVDALNDAKIYDVIVVGVDGVKEALQAVKNEEILGTVISNSMAQAEGIFNIAYLKAINGDLSNVDGLEGKYIKTKHIKVDKENVDLYLN
ncbi:galactose ABC transporter substrate-binding protein [Clostridium sp. NSJ-49]|uniref:D-galactose/methyl-galactoside binding periplasmic protein MglB n=1 Tax=Clostridium disporicum TaxID=84024 RepID=A0A174JHJ8_9CLOT|nr:MULTISPECIES: galactose ABC transporter substrate-binding protein [Clostridium]MBC5626053.1 galactose ABC transporter substrate-binding protein [Clostridium sp. NSJ-49]MCD2501759.1 galactose ABC transporter substrate-binding protein [Clostridium sp. NSJ-145]MDU6340675.1 galactose ABC transporter substrate-binding protein [Clostridium sp.]CUO99182.1 D-galactose-binding periplasmic protein [Clostridium disporicum]